MPSSNGPRKRVRVGQEILDESALLARFEGEARVAERCGNLFLEECPKLINGIRGAVERSDAQGMERAAHKLKGPVANFSAPAAYDAALRLEVMGREGHLEPGSRSSGAARVRALQELGPVLIT